MESVALNRLYVLKDNLIKSLCDAKSSIHGPFIYEKEYYIASCIFRLIRLKNPNEPFIFMQEHLNYHLDRCVKIADPTIFEPPGEDFEGEQWYERRLRERGNFSCLLQDVAKLREELTQTNDYIRERIYSRLEKKMFLDDLINKLSKQNSVIISLCNEEWVVT